MDKKENVTPIRKHGFHIELRTLGGEVLFEMNLEAPLPFPYVFWNERLFVMSKDDPGILLERSYCMWVDEPPLPKDQH